MAGVYIHIPFCRSKCAYCDFYSMPLSAAVSCGGQDIYARYSRCVIAELRMRISELRDPVTTIYIGGGTPTAMPADIMINLISEVRAEVEVFNSRLKDLATSDKTPYPAADNYSQGRSLIEEFTVEANPEDISEEMLTALQNAGVDRISIGVQSFDSRQLDAINRRHGADLSLKALETLSKEGINYSADLIYGLPGQSPESWESQLKQLLAFRPPHFSAYLLSYEPGTRLYALREKGGVEEVSETTAAVMYDTLCSMASASGHIHYEISNFALPGKEARHNSSYWDFTPYLGLGCSAHSFDGTNRRVNPSNLAKYVAAIEKGSSAAVIEEETRVNRANDYIITSLRTHKGLCLNLFKTTWGEHLYSGLSANAAPLISQEMLLKEDNTLKIPENHWLTADYILRELIL